MSDRKPAHRGVRHPLHQESAGLLLNFPAPRHAEGVVPPSENSRDTDKGIFRRLGSAAVKRVGGWNRGEVPTLAVVVGMYAAYVGGVLLWEHRKNTEPETVVPPDYYVSMKVRPQGETLEQLIHRYGLRHNHGTAAYVQRVENRLEDGPHPTARIGDEAPEPIVNPLEPLQPGTKVQFVRDELKRNVTYTVPTPSQ